MIVVILLCAALALFVGVSLVNALLCRRRRRALYVRLAMDPIRRFNR